MRCSPPPPRLVHHHYHRIYQNACGFINLSLHHTKMSQVTGSSQAGGNQPHTKRKVGHSDTVVTEVTRILKKRKENKDGTTGELEFVLRCSSLRCGCSVARHAGNVQNEHGVGNEYDVSCSIGAGCYRLDGWDFLPGDSNGLWAYAGSLV